jgi:hypothetical protein
MLRLPAAPRRTSLRGHDAALLRRPACHVRPGARGNTGAPRHAEQLAPAIGLPVAVVEVALKRQSYGIKPITDGVINDQQQVADTFFALGLIPKQIKISDVARRSGS